MFTMGAAAAVLALSTALLSANAAQAAGADISCAQELGKRRAAVLVKQCLQVSPATHPPCNAANACVLIREEIKRSCDLLGADKNTPAFCQAAR
jgi:hypothetical protein